MQLFIQREKNIVIGFIVKVGVTELWHDSKVESLSFQFSKSGELQDMQVSPTIPFSFRMYNMLCSLEYHAREFGLRGLDEEPTSPLGKAVPLTQDENVSGDFCIIVTSVPADRKISLIKALRTISGYHVRFIAADQIVRRAEYYSAVDAVRLGLKDAKEFAECLPGRIEGLSELMAKIYAEELASSEAKVLVAKVEKTEQTQDR